MDVSALFLKIIRKKNKYDLDTYDYGVGYTLSGQEFYFDKDDFDKIKDYCWRIDKKDKYVVTTYRGKILLFHRIVMNVMNNNDVEIDHISHINYDNRKINLRISNKIENSRNKGLTKRNTSGYTGVSWNEKRNEWEVYIFINYKKIHLGWTKDKNEAIKIRKEAEEKYFGEYSYDNSMKIAKENSIIENKY